MVMLTSDWSVSPINMKEGPNQARAPVTNATQVKPSVDSINEGLQWKRYGEILNIIIL